MDKKIITVIGVVALLLLVVFNQQTAKETKKISPAGAVVARTLPAKVQPDTNMTVTVGVSGVTGDYFAVLRENIPTGWTYVSGGQLETGQVKGIASTLTGPALTFVLNAPSSTATSTFSGTYQFTDDTTAKVTGGSTTVKVCSIHTSTQCYDNDEYWYDSCLDRETLKTDCGVNSCDSYEADYCSGLNVNHDRTCYTRGCTANACFVTPYDETQTIETCTWRCTSGSCMRNSAADTNNDGVVGDTELLAYANTWLVGTVTDMDLLTAAGVWLGQSEHPVEV